MVNIDIRKVPNVTGRFYIHSIDTKKIGASKGQKTSRLTASISKTNIPQNSQKVNSGISNNSNMQCRVTIDVTPFIYTKSDRCLKMLINQTHLRKDLIAHE